MHHTYTNVYLYKHTYICIILYTKFVCVSHPFKVCNFESAWQIDKCLGGHASNWSGRSSGLVCTMYSVALKLSQAVASHLGQ